MNDRPPPVRGALTLVRTVVEHLFTGDVLGATRAVGLLVVEALATISARRSASLRGRTGTPARVFVVPVLALLLLLHTLHRDVGVQPPADVLPRLALSLLVVGVLVPFVPERARRVAAELRGGDQGAPLP